MTKYAIPALIFLIITTGAAFCANTADIIQAGISPRSASMGRAFTAIAGGIKSTSFNPAGIANSGTFEITTMQTKILTLVDYKLYGGMLSTNYGFFGVNYLNALTPAGFATTDKNSMAGAASMAYSASTLVFSYAQNLNKLIRTGKNAGNLAVGFNYKLIQNTMSGVVNGNGAGSEADFGIMLSPSNNFNIGASLQNISRASIKWGSGATDTLPAILRFGVSYKINEPNILFAVDSENISESSYPILLHGGAEWQTTPNLAIRAGVDQTAGSQSSIANNITLGIGLKLRGILFDYGYKRNSIQSEADINYISISYAPADGI